MNVCGLLRCKDEFENWIISIRPDIICITETHVTSDIPDNEIALKNYNVSRTDSDNHRTGGVLTYVKKGIHFRSGKVASIDGSWINIIKININNGLTICNLYRSPSSSLSKFCKMITKLTDELGEERNDLILLGDFNIDVLKNVNYSKKLLKELEVLGLRQQVNLPTRSTMTSETIIDLVFSNFYINTKVLDTPKLSDHNIVICDIPRLNEIVCKKENYSSRDYRHFNSMEFQNELSMYINKIKWLDERTNEKEFDTMCDNLINSISLSLNKCAPYKVKKLEYNWEKKPWINKSIVEKMKERDKLFRKAKLSKLTSDLIGYKKLRNMVVQLIKNSKRSFYESKIDNNKRDTKKLWKSLKELIGDKKNNGVILKEINLSGVVLTDSKTIANELNNFFIRNIETIVDNINSDNNINLHINCNSSYWDIFQKVTYTKLDKIISKLDSKKGFKNDINVQTLKLVWETHSDLVLNLINKSLDLGFVPSRWKISTITPIQKIKNSIKAEDLRPVNTLPVYEQILERVVKEYLEQFLEKNNIINQNQSGFIKKHSCESALQDSFIEWRHNLDQGLMVGLVCIDLRKAFETLNIDILINKLYNIGLRDTVLNWFKSYLYGRKQKVKFDNVLSEEQEIKYGVPQGSILGPLLFLIYINDLVDIFEGLEIKCKLFADDIMLFFSSNNISLIEKVLNEALKRLLNWLNNNQMKINISKTVFMVIRDRRSKLYGKCEINVKNEKIKEVTETKYLGIIIDNALNFDSNANYVAKKIAKKINVLYRLNHNVSNYTKCILYKSIVLPHFDYCSSVMINYSQNKLDIFQKLQNRAMRVILGVNKYTSVAKMLETLGWLSIKQRMMYNLGIFVYKMVNSFFPAYLCDRIQPNSVRNYYNTRNNNLINIVNTRTKSAEKTITYLGYNFFNDLPNEIQSQATIPAFKRLLVTWIKTNIDI